MRLGLYHEDSICLPRPTLAWILTHRDYCRYRAVRPVSLRFFIIDMMNLVLY